MEGVNRRSLRILVGVWEWWLIVHDRRRRDVRRYDECLNIEAADELPVAFPVLVGLDVALIPREAKGCIRDLDDEEVELGIWRQPADVDVHLLDWAQGFDSHTRACVGQTGGCSR